jgi:hypothetical protein
MEFTVQPNRAKQNINVASRNGQSALINHSVGKITIFASITRKPERCGTPHARPAVWANRAYW